MTQEIIEISPQDVKIGERFRDDLGDIKELATSIKRQGQLQPIQIDQDNRLLYGYRRLCACMQLGRKVQAVRKTVEDELQRKLIELTENLDRKSFTWRERCLAIKKIHDLHQEKYGKSVEGVRGGWTIQDTADQIGRSRGSVSDALDMAKYIHIAPFLFDDLKTQDEARKLIKGLKSKKEKISPKTGGGVKIKSINPPPKPDPPTGDLLNYEDLVYEPTNENGVLFLFGKLHKRLGFKVEAIQEAFPDVRARKKNDKGLWETISIELEHKSSNFIDHGHPIDECDVIVCWEDDWEDCKIKVIELKSYIKKLKGELHDH